jgi:hypothetical protein
MVMVVYRFVIPHRLRNGCDPGGIEGIEYLGNVDNERYRTGVE